MKDKCERYIEKRFGHSCPYSPSGEYLESFESRLMSRLPSERPGVVMRPAKKKVSLWNVSWAAAAVCAACICLTVMLRHGGNSQVGRQHNASCEVEYASPFDAMADYTMSGTDDMYAFMADAEY